ncbi:hypothetical protein C5167_044855 [Papaver somniferum]|nr:hypothetical protein C5167_044855 [Papaver somniferum]
MMSFGNSSVRLDISLPARSAASENILVPPQRQTSAASVPSASGSASPAATDEVQSTSNPPQHHMQTRAKSGIVKPGISLNCTH